MIDILLVNPKERGGFFEKMPPLGLASIAASLERNGFSVKIIDFEVTDGKLKYWLSHYEPRILGISGTTHTRFESFRLAKEAKNFNKEIITIYGGVHATFTAIDTLKNIKEIDFVVRGEGEYSTVNLLRAIRQNSALAKVNGISYRKRGEIIENPPQGRIVALNALSPPAYHLLDMCSYSLNMDFLDKKGISIITSRGCRYRCNFCSASRMFNHRVTFSSAGRVVSEIENLFKNYGYDGIKVFDSTFTIKKGHVISICDEIIRRGLKFPWECEVRVGTVKRELLEKMRDAGCYYVDFGIESGSQRVLNLMGKGITVDQSEKLLQTCKDLGVKTKVFFSFGHLGETMADVRKTFEFIDQHRSEITTLACGAGVRIYPGTSLEIYARKNSLLPQNFSWSLPYDDERLATIFQTRQVPVLIQPQLGMRELQDIGIRIYGSRFGGWKGFKLGMTKIKDISKLKKLFIFLKLKAKRVIKSL